jgi:hypothetical protein
MQHLAALDNRLAVMVNASFLAGRIALLDGLLFVAVWATVFAATAPQSGVFYVALRFLALLAALVVWRGARNAARQIAGEVTVYQAVAEGARIGALLALSMFLLSWLAPSAFAAGHVLDGFSPARPADWLLFFAVAGPLVALGAAVGAAHGVALHQLNRWLIKRRFPK